MNRQVLKGFCSQTNKKLSFREKYNFKNYGKYGVYIYLITSAGTFTTFYYLISRNYIDKKATFNWLESKGYKPQTYIDKYGDGKINVALAYTCLFVSKPLRIVFTCVLAGYLSKVRSQEVKKVAKQSLLKQFGVAGFSVYMSFWAFTGLTMYYLVKNKYIDRTKVTSKIKGTFLESYYNNVEKRLGDKNADIVVAYFLNAILEIVRLPAFIFFFKLYMKRKGK